MSYIFNPITGNLDYYQAGSTPADASSTVKGITKLTNDLGGTADLPTVVGVHLDSELIITDAQICTKPFTYVDTYSAGNIPLSIYLPAPATVGAGYIQSINDYASQAATYQITVYPNASEYIDGSTSPVIIGRNHTTVEFITDGASWYSVVNPTYNLNRVAVTSGTYTMLSTDDIVSFTGIAGGGVTLPDASVAGAGKTVVIVDDAGISSTFNITISSAGGKTINGLDSISLGRDYGSVTLFSNGVNWFTSFNYPDLLGTHILTTATMTLFRGYEVVIYTGNSTPTWTLPTAVGYSGQKFSIKNMSTIGANMTVVGYGVSEVQTISVIAGGGDFTASFGPATTAAMAYNISSADMQTELRNLYTIGSGNITVASRTGTGVVGDPYLYACTFAGSLAKTNVEQMTVVDSTTGAGHAVTVSTTTAGVNTEAIDNLIAGITITPKDSLDLISNNTSWVTSENYIKSLANIGTVGRNPVSNTAGVDTTIQAGSATMDAVNKAGGNLSISAGTATGAQTGTVAIQAPVAGASSSSIDNTPTTIMSVSGAGIVMSKRLTINGGFTTGLQTTLDPGVYKYGTLLYDTPYNYADSPTITVTSATGGDFTVTFGANTTAALAYNVTAADMQTAVTGLASVGAGNCDVTLAGTVYTLSFAGHLSPADMKALSVTDNTTGAGHTITVAQSKTGVSQISLNPIADQDSNPTTLSTVFPFHMIASGGSEMFKVSTNNAAYITIKSTSTNVSDGDTITIGTKTYRFKTTMGAAYDIKIGSTVGATFTNLKAAINLSGTAGTEFFQGTATNSAVTTANLTTSVVAVSLDLILSDITALGSTVGVSTTSKNLFFQYVITTNGTNPADGDIIGIGGQYYRFKTTMTQAFDVRIGSTAYATLSNLAKAIGATGTAGKEYYTGTTANASITAGTSALNTLRATTLYITISSNSAQTITKCTPTTTSTTFTFGSALAFATSDGTEIADGDTITIDTRTYRFKTTMSQAYDVKRNGTATTTLDNLIKAINLSGTAGTHYYTGTAAHTSVRASSRSGNTFGVFAINAGTAGNSIAKSTTATHISWDAGGGGTTLSGGVAQTFLDGYLQVTQGQLSTTIIGHSATENLTTISGDKYLISKDGPMTTVGSNQTAAVTFYLPPTIGANAPSTGQDFLIADASGSASTTPITINPISGTALNEVIKYPYGFVWVKFLGTSIARYAVVNRGDYRSFIQSIADYYADVGNGTTVETDIFTKNTTLPGVVGNKIKFSYTTKHVGHATATRQNKVYFGGTAIFDSGAMSSATDVYRWIEGEIIIDTTTSVRCIVKQTGVTDPQYTTVTGLTLTSAQTLKITGTAAGVGAATDDIVGKLGYVQQHLSV